MTAEEKLGTEELQVLMNIFGEELEISYSPLHLAVATVRPAENQYKVTVKSSREDFDKALDYDIFEKEKPSYNDIFDCLLNSGVIQYSNMGEFAEKVNVYRSLNETLYFTPDTNIFYHGFLSNSDLIKPEEILLVNTVRDEIESSLNCKYDNHQINMLKKLAKFQGNLFDELRNRRMKRSRRAAYLAMYDFRSIRDRATKLEPVSASVADGRENDLTIARTLGKFSRENNCMALLITADNLMTDICEAEGIAYFHFKIPPKTEYSDYMADARQVRKLLYNLASLLGFIKVNNTILFGEYRGKTNPSELKARFLNDCTSKDFKRELEVCRKLSKLHIPK